jgi:hypothetical protein
MRISEELYRIKTIMYEEVSDTSLKDYLQNEIDEIQRVSQYLNREEGIDVSVDDLFDKFLNSDEEKLTDEIWDKLENTESNTEECDSIEKVIEIAKKYNKTSPKKLKKSLESGDYNRPLIIKFNDRYHLVAGNTRLCTASAIGMNPMVYIVEI